MLAVFGSGNQRKPLWFDFRWSNSEYMILMDTGVYFAGPNLTSPQLVKIATLVHEHIALLKEVAVQLVTAYVDKADIGNIDETRLYIGDPQVRNPDSIDCIQVPAFCYSGLHIPDLAKAFYGPTCRDHANPLNTAVLHRRTWVQALRDRMGYDSLPLFLQKPDQKLLLGNQFVDFGRLAVEKGRNLDLLFRVRIWGVYATEFSGGNMHHSDNAMCLVFHDRGYSLQTPV